MHVPRMLLAAAATLVVPSALAAASTPTVGLKAPAVTPIGGGVVVGWGSAGGAQTSAVVTADPPGPTCATTTRRTCTVPITSAGSERFAVTVTTSSGSVTSAWSTPVRASLVVVLAGQSNATGQTSYAVDPASGTNYLRAPFATAADALDLLWLWRFSPTVPYPKGLVPLGTPQVLSTPAGTRAVFGPELGLARQLTADRGLSVAIVKVTYPGSAIASWLPRAAKALFPAVVTQTQQAESALVGRRIVPVVSGVVWFQGETEALTPQPGTAYAASLAQVLGGFRHAFGPRLPLVLVQESSALVIAEETHAHQCAPVQCQQLAAADTAVRSSDAQYAATHGEVRAVDTADLPRTSPGVHLSNVGELTLGVRVAAALEGLLP